MEKLLILSGQMITRKTMLFLVFFLSSTFPGLLFAQYQHWRNYLDGHTVNAIAIDGNDNKWIGTDNGLALYNENLFPVSIDPGAADLKSDKFGYRVYPNPVSGNITLEWLPTMAGSPSPARLQICALQGNPLLEKELTLDTLQEISLEGVSFGFFILRINNLNTISNIKLIKR